MSHFIQMFMRETFMKWPIWSWELFERIQRWWFWNCLIVVKSETS
jgi:hypothetical protein